MIQAEAEPKLTKEKAEAILKHVEGVSIDVESYIFGQAKGFLEGVNSPEALKRKEVLGLVEIAQETIYWGLDSIRRDALKNALSKFKEAAKL